MSTHFNELTPAEQERLVMLGEEANEVGLEVSKTLRHGYNSYHPMDPLHETNRDRVAREAGDLLGILIAMVHFGDLDINVIKKAAAEKWARSQKYTHHQG